VLPRVVVDPPPTGTSTPTTGTSTPTTSTSTPTTDTATPTTGTSTPTPSKKWGTAEIIERKAGGASSPQIAVDANGNAIAVWVEWNDPRYNIWASRYLVGQRWGSSELITDNTVDASSPQIAVDTKGNAIVVWVQSDGIRPVIWARRYIAGLGWENLLNSFSNWDGPADLPQVSFDIFGNAMVVWQGANGTGSNDIWANRYVAGQGWEGSRVIDWRGGNATVPQIAIDSRGDAVAVWQQHDGVQYNDIWANRYVSGVWGEAALIENNTGYDQAPQVAVDLEGNAIVVWHNYAVNGRFDIWATRYVAGNGWEKPSLIEQNDSGSAYNPKVVVDAKGGAIAVWEQSGNAGGGNIWANQYTPNGGWKDAQLIEANEGSAHSPRIAVDSSGNAIAVWSQYTGRGDSIYANRYTTSGGWETAQIIEIDDEPASSPQVAVNASGNAIAVWTQYNYMWANRFE
jgi:hypothetical protein